MCLNGRDVMNVIFQDHNNLIINICCKLGFQYIENKRNKYLGYNNKNNIYIYKIITIE